MLQLELEHSAILSIFIKLPFVIKIFVLSIFWVDAQVWFYCNVKMKVAYQNSLMPMCIMVLQLTKKGIELNRTTGLFISEISNFKVDIMWFLSKKMYTNTRTCPKYGV